MDSVTSITEKLIAHMASISGADARTLSIETALQDIGLDSMILAHILRAVEEDFSIEFEDDEIADFLGALSIGDYVGILNRALNRKASAAV